MFQSNPHYSRPSAVAEFLASIDLAAMGPVIAALLAAAGVALFLFAAYRLVSAALRPTRARAGRMRPGLVPTPWRGPRHMHDPADQMKVVSQVDFRTVRLLNRSEYQLLPLLESIARDLRAGHRVMAQTSLGEIIEPAGVTDRQLRSAAHASINSKRLDFAIFDSAGYLALAIEYQGQGHYAPTAFMRDAVKREALRKAGVPFLEVPAMFRPADIRAQVIKLLQLEADRPPQPRTAATSSGAPIA